MLAFFEGEWEKYGGEGWSELSWASQMNQISFAH